MAGVFLLALMVRLVGVLATPGSNYHNTDLEIYRLGGALIREGINPYLWEEGIETREALRQSTVSEWLRADQPTWDYFVSSNLPFNILVYGAIDGISSHPLWYRTVFAVADSVVSVLILCFVLLHWPVRSLKAGVGFALAIGALSPLFLVWGVQWPEDKGIQILLMLVAMLALKSKERRLWLLLSPCALGLSVAFKGLGIFLLPWGVFKVWQGSRERVKDLFVFALLFTAFSAVWALPFLPEVLDMVRSRLANNVIEAPGHASIWAWISSVLPRAWLWLRYLLIGALCGLTGWGLKRRAVDVELASITFLLVFVDVLLTQGSLDRMNIGLILSLLVMGQYSGASRLLLTVAYSAIGLFAAMAALANSPIGFRRFVDDFVYQGTETHAGIFVMIYILIFVTLLAKQALTPKPLGTEPLN